MASSFLQISNWILSAGSLWCLKDFAGCSGVALMARLDTSPHSCLDNSAAQTSGKEPSWGWALQECSWKAPFCPRFVHKSIRQGQKGTAQTQGILNSSWKYLAKSFKCESDKSLKMALKLIHDEGMSLQRSKTWLVWCRAREKSKIPMMLSQGRCLGMNRGGFLWTAAAAGEEHGKACEDLLNPATLPRHL